MKKNLKWAIFIVLMNLIIHVLAAIGAVVTPMLGIMIGYLGTGLLITHVIVNLKSEADQLKK